MCGSETLTTVVSSTSMKVLVITAIATSHGFTSFHALAELRSKVWLAVAISDESYEMHQEREWTRIAGQRECRYTPGLWIRRRRTGKPQKPSFVCLRGELELNLRFQ